MKRLTSLFLLVLGLWLTPRAAESKMVDVAISGFAFNQQTVNITVGDSVRWTNHDAVIHTSTSNTGVWNSGNLSKNSSYTFRFTTAGSFPYFCAIHPSMTGTVNVASPSDVSESGGQNLPEDFRLSQNYPNPFNSETRIDFTVPVASHVTITITNELGQLVKTLVDGEQSAGNYSIRWDGKNEKGISVPTGIYFYRMQAGQFQISRRMNYIR